MIKPNAKILDACAANRVMWKTKESPYILWVDVEPELELEPDIVVNNENTDFEDKRFHTIFYDPPHMYGQHSGFYLNKTHEDSIKYWTKYNSPQHIRKVPRYYGLDKYDTKAELLQHIAAAQREFFRILQDGGMLWLKWCEVQIQLNEVLDLFFNWNEMMRIYVSSPAQTAGKTDSKPKQTYWVSFMKKHDAPVQVTL